VLKSISENKIRWYLQGMSKSAPIEGFADALASSVSNAFKKLLSEKHLYQSVEVDDSFVNRIATRFASTGHGFEDRYKEIGQNLFSGAWTPSSKSRELEMLGVSQASVDGSFEYPTILTYCHHCTEKWPFNSIGSSGFYEKGKTSDSEQWFFCSYECQNCKQDAVRFLVRRSGKKLTLSGRDPIETVPIHTDIPKNVRRFFSNAVIAHNAGQTLAGIFFLRVFIEQFWSSRPAITKAITSNARLSGEERGGIYMAELPEDFKTRCPSLLSIYSKLSMAMHEATADAPLFEKSCSEIITHFEARRIFRLDIPAR